MKPSRRLKFDSRRNRFSRTWPAIAILAFLAGGAGAKPFRTAVAQPPVDTREDAASEPIAAEEPGAPDEATPDETAAPAPVESAEYVAPEQADPSHVESLSPDLSVAEE